MNSTLTVSNARKDLASLVQNVYKRLDEYIITVNGSPQAVLLSVQEYESWKETNEILANRHLLRAIVTSEKELAEGQGLDWEQVKQELLA